MPDSYPVFKGEVTDWLLNNVPKTARILDVGPGEGTYSRLLKPYGYSLDCVEIWEPYVDRFNLNSHYDRVFIEDILNFQGLDLYDFIILGDVLEHIPAGQAQKLIRTILAKKIGCLVAVPYSMPQGEYDGNIYETHHQEDLTPEIMSSRYPGLELIYGNNFYGYYINKPRKYEKAYVLYTTESYSDLANICCKSLKYFGDLPIIVYMLNSDRKIQFATETVRWDCDVNVLENREDFIERKDSNIYRLLKERPKIMLDALERAEVAVYVDTDSIASPHVNHIFDFYDPEATYPFFTKGIYDVLILDGKGGADGKDDLYNTIEHNACELFNIDQKTREDYRQTGFFVCGQKSIPFLQEWYWMCTHPAILKDNYKYAPFHEETIMNVLRWKYSLIQGLPLVYINGLHRDLVFTGQEQYLESWVKAPTSKENLMFYHGEKDIKKLNDFLNYLIDRKI